MVICSIRRTGEEEAEEEEEHRRAGAGEGRHREEEEEAGCCPTEEVAAGYRKMTMEAEAGVRRRKHQEGDHKRSYTPFQEQHQEERQEEHQEGHRAHQEHQEQPKEAHHQREGEEGGGLQQAVPRERRQLRRDRWGEAVARVPSWNHRWGQ